MSTDNYSVYYQINCDWFVFMRWRRYFNSLEFNCVLSRVELVLWTLSSEKIAVEKPLHNNEYHKTSQHSFSESISYMKWEK
jgi:hypothetical protein